MYMIEAVQSEESLFPIFIENIRKYRGCTLSPPGVRDDYYLYCLHEACLTMFVLCYFRERIDCEMPIAQSVPDV